VFPTLVSYDEEGKPFTVRYELLTPLLLNEFQRQEEELKALHGLEGTLREQQGELEALRKEVTNLKRNKAEGYRARVIPAQGARLLSGCLCGRIEIFC
jgi:hypothetical protein